MTAYDPDERLATDLLNRQISKRLQIIVNAQGGVSACARALELSTQRLSNYLRGGRTLSAYTISLICTRLDVSADWLILGKRR